MIQQCQSEFKMARAKLREAKKMFYNNFCILPNSCEQCEQSCFPLTAMICSAWLGGEDGDWGLGDPLEGRRLFSDFGA